MNALAATINYHAELGKLLPANAKDPAFKEKIDKTARYLMAHFTVDQWFEAMGMVPVEPPQEGMQNSVIHRAAEITDKRRRRWRTIGIVGMSLSVLSIGATFWVGRRECPTGRGR